MRTFTFHLAIDYQTYLNVYAGSAKTILVQSDQGLRLQLPANRFQSFVSHNGLRGRFKVIINQDNKIVEILRVSA
uniref:DUF2835 family protein n=1 Tax=Thaumasiovibrio occultus TaxID=1891184 RepID=UPI000B361842|nr:DUF2835 family protein [Thaumasiovibrio occultus]